MLENNTKPNLTTLKLDTQLLKNIKLVVKRKNLSDEFLKEFVELCIEAVIGRIIHQETKNIVLIDAKQKIIVIELDKEDCEKLTWLAQSQNLLIKPLAQSLLTQAISSHYEQET